MKNIIKLNLTQHGWRRFLTIFSYWIRGFWPVLIVLVVGATYLRDAVVDSILSTPHPALVYGIFGVAGAAVLLTGVALFRYVREESLLLNLQSIPVDKRLVCLQKLSWRPDVLSVCMAILNHDRRPEERLSAIEHELYAYEEHLASPLTLPGYLSGALVGLGLVGTFVGLLGTLADLAGLFSAMTNMGGQNTDPVAMFTDMLNKLQAPMRSMGTAFVASLYGLLGSLVLGLVIYSVKRTGTVVLGQVRSLIRLTDNERASTADLVNYSADSKRPDDALLQLTQAIHGDRMMLTKSVLSIASDFKHHLQLTSERDSAARDRPVPIALTPESMAPLVQLVNAALLNQSAMLEQTRTSAQAHQSAMREIIAKLALISHPDAPVLGRSVMGVLLLCAAVLVISTGVTLSLFIKDVSGQTSAVLGTNASDKNQGSVAASVFDRGVAPTVVEAEPAQVDVPDLKMSAVGVTPAALVPASLPTVKVRSGQSLARIAAHARIPLVALIAANPKLKNPDQLLVGQSLYIPLPSGAPLN